MLRRSSLVSGLEIELPQLVIVMRKHRHAVHAHPALIAVEDGAVIVRDIMTGIHPRRGRHRVHEMHSDVSIADQIAGLAENPA